MNKKEHSKICHLIAEWEWASALSVTESSTYGACSRTLKDEFGIADNDPELMFARAYKIFSNSSYTNDETFDLIVDAVDENYEKVVDLIEEFGFDSFVEFLLKGN